MPCVFALMKEAVPRYEAQSLVADLPFDQRPWNWALRESDREIFVQMVRQAIAERPLEVLLRQLSQAVEGGPKPQGVPSRKNRGRASEVFEMREGFCEHWARQSNLPGVPLRQ